MSWNDYDLSDEGLNNEMFGDNHYGYDDMDEYVESDDDMGDEEYGDDDFDDDELIDVSDFDFSSLDGKNLKSDLKKITRTANKKPVLSRTVSPRKNKIQVQKPSSAKPMTSRPVPHKQKPSPSPLLKKKVSSVPVRKQKPSLLKRKSVPVKHQATIHSRNGRKTTEKILVPSDREVIVEGVDKFILSNTKESNAIKDIGYYKGEKLKELVLIINNDTPNDFDIELFNPSSSLDYLYATSNNLNTMIQVAGDNKVSYSDVLFNLLANPALLPNAKFTVSGAQQAAQFNQALIFKNKNIAGHEKIHPLQMNLNIDIDQNQKQIVYWNIMETLGRPYIPDGMDVIQYKVLAGNQVVFGFYYKQASIKRFFYPEARDKRIL